MGGLNAGRKAYGGVRGRGEGIYIYGGGGYVEGKRGGEDGFLRAGVFCGAGAACGAA